MAGNLWKASSEHGGNLAVLTTSNWGETIYILDANTGALIDEGKFDKTYEDGRSIYRFNHPGRDYNNVVVLNVNTGEHFYISNGAHRYDNLQTSTAKNNGDEWRKKHPDAWQFDPATFQTTQTGDITPSTDSNVPGIEGVGNVAKPILMSMEGFEFKDPIEKMRALAKENNGIIDENFIKSLADANILSKADQNQLIDYLNTMSPLQMQMVGIENQFNQQQKLQNVDTAIPGARDKIYGALNDAQTLSQGRLLTSIEDRAFEQTARNTGADAAWTRGLGDDSLVGKRLSDQLSVSQRTALMQQGQNYLMQSMQIANGMLVDTPNKAALSQQIAGAPQNSFSALAGQQQGLRNEKTTLDAAAGMNAFVSVQKDFNDTLLQINAANTQAVNKFNQDIINDQMATQAAEAKKLALQQASFAKEHKLIDEDEYKKILAEIELTGTIDMDAWSKDFKYYWEKYQQDKIYGEGKGPEDYSETMDPNRTPTDITSPTGGSQGAGGTQGGTSGGEGSSGSSGGEGSSGSSGGEGETQESTNKTFSVTSMLATSTAKSGQDPTRIVQVNGNITPFIQVPYDFSKLNSSDYLMGFLNKLLNGEYSSGVNND